MNNIVIENLVKLFWNWEINRKIAANKVLFVKVSSKPIKENITNNLRLLIKKKLSEKKKKTDK